MAHTIRYYSTTEETLTCAMCGKLHRHTTEIDGLTYGKSCGIKKMGELELIDTSAVSYRLEAIDATDIKAIVNPTRRAFVRQDWIEYQISKLASLDRNAAIFNAKNTPLDAIDARIARLAQRNQQLASDWQIIRKLAGLWQ